MRAILLLGICVIVSGCATPDQVVASHKRNINWWSQSLTGKQAIPIMSEPGLPPQTDAFIMRRAGLACAGTPGDMDAVLHSLKVRGWTATGSDGAGVVSLAHGTVDGEITGTVYTAGQRCRFQAPGLSIDRAIAIGEVVRTTYFEDGGKPLGAGKCDGHRGMVEGHPVTIRYAGAGTDAQCSPPGAAMIITR